jgi:ATP-binding cassette, subfamily C, bacterial LapB
MSVTFATDTAGTTLPGSAASPIPNGRPLLSSLLHGGNMDQFVGSSTAGSCLMPLLDKLGWRGEARHLVEALPHFIDDLDFDDVRTILANLNYGTTALSMRLCDLRPSQLPCLFSTDGQHIGVIFSRDGDTLSIFDGKTKTEGTIDAGRTKGTAYLVNQEDALESSPAQKATDSWIWNVVGRFKRLIVQTFAISFITNITALMVPIFIMGVYDRVISTRSAETLAYFVAGILLIIGVEAALRIIRGRALAYLGARIDALVGGASFQQLLNMPVSMTESAPVATQLNRLRQFEGVREIFTGPLAAAAFDLPFVIVFLAAIFVIAGSIGWVPVTLIFAFTLFGFVMAPIMKKAMAESGEIRNTRQNFLIELVSKQRTLKQCAAEDIWRNRFYSISERASVANARTARINMFIQTVAQALMTISGVATLAIGTLYAMQGDLTIGALIATMAFVWRVLGPIQSIFLSFSRISQVSQSLKQIDGLMKLPLERNSGKLPSFFRTFKGGISLNNVSLRFSAGSEPALMGAALTVTPGEFIAINGSNGAGKSTLLKVIAGLYKPQAGSVSLDGLDIRQLDAGEMRNSIAYLPQNATFFYGTIAQNLRLADPTASDKDIDKALSDAGLTDYVASLPEGANSRFSQEDFANLAGGVRQRLNLARAYVKNAPMLLLDEPAFGLDDAADEALVNKLMALKGKSTILMVTHRPSHMRLADRLVYLDQGRVALDGPPGAVLDRLNG